MSKKNMDDILREVNKDGDPVREVGSMTYVRRTADSPDSMEEQALQAGADVIVRFDFPEGKPRRFDPGSIPVIGIVAGDINTFTLHPIIRSLLGVLKGLVDDDKQDALRLLEDGDLKVTVLNRIAAMDARINKSIEVMEGREEIA